MDGLDLLKKDWKNQEKNLPQFKKKELYPLLLKKSSSIVKWIFIISVIELSLGVIFNLAVIDDDFWKEIEFIHLKTATIISYIINYLVMGVFIYLFYKNYRAISATDSVSKLMKNILKTRKVVRYYIIYIIVSTGIVSLLFFIFSFIYPPSYIQLENKEVNWVFVIAVGMIFIAILLGILWGFYAILYGILLKRLKQNYRELNRLDL